MTLPFGKLYFLQREREKLNTRKKEIQITLVAIYIHSQVKSHTKSSKKKNKKITTSGTTSLH